MKKNKKHITLDLQKEWNNSIRKQKYINMLVAIQDKIFQMSMQGYSLAYTNMRTIKKRYKQGVLFFKRK